MMKVLDAPFTSRSNLRAVSILSNSSSSEAHLRNHIEAVGGSVFCQNFRFNATREDFKSPYLVEGGTLLHMCWEHGSEMMTRVLLDMGVPVNALDINGDTVLHHICGKRVSRCDKSPEAYYAVIQCKVPLLVAAGADMMLPDRLDHTPLVVALHSDASIPVILKLLEYGGSARASNARGHTLLHHAQRCSDAALELFLGMKCVDIDARNNRGSTVLHHACATSPTCDNASRSVESRIQALISAGANLEVKDEYGRTPLNEAITIGSISVIHQLLSVGASVQTLDNENSSVLQDAAMNAPPEVFKLFLDMECMDINYQDKHGFSVLHYCELHNLPLLFQRGVNMSIKNHKGQDAVKYWDSEPTVKNQFDKRVAWQTEVRRRRCAEAVAFAMGDHARLGAHSRVRALKPDVVRLILSFAGKLDEDE